MKRLTQIIIEDGLEVAEALSEEQFTEAAVQDLMHIHRLNIDDGKRERMFQLVLKGTLSRGKEFAVVRCQRELKEVLMRSIDKMDPQLRKEVMDL